MKKNTDAPVSDAAGVEKLGCEVKFLLDADRVLAKGKRLKKKFRALFEMEPHAQAIDVLYLETPDKAFLAEGWVVRIRWKEGKKKTELAFKKRYPVDGADEAAVLSALRQAEADGFVLAVEDGYKSELDWGYAKKALSFTWRPFDAFKKVKVTDWFSAWAAAEFLEKAMTCDEQDWHAVEWAVSTLERAQLIGPIRIRRFRGRWDGVGVTVELCPIGEGKTIAELSFKADDWKAAAETRSRLMAFLDEQGLLIRGDSLKTQAILNAALPAAKKEEQSEPVTDSGNVPPGAEEQTSGSAPSPDDGIGKISAEPAATETSDPV